MSIRTLLGIVLKVLGLLFIKDILGLLPQFLWLLSYEWNNNMTMELVWPLSTNLFMLFVYTVAAYYLIWKTEHTIDRLKLLEGFTEETIALNMHRSTVLSIAIIVIGGLMLATEIPNLLRQIILLRQEENHDGGFSGNELFLITTVVKIALGVLLIMYQRHIVNLIELKQKNKSS